MPALKVPARDLLFALSQRRHGTPHYLDTTTGEVIPVFSFNHDVVMAQIKAEPDRYLRVAPQTSRRGYVAMEQFAWTVDQELLRNELESALKQEHAFRAFRNVLKQDPREYARWQRFHCEAMAEGIRTKLKDRGITLELVFEQD